MNTRHWLLPLLVALLVAAALTLPLQQWLRAAIEWTAANREVAGAAFVALYIVATVCFVPGLPLTLAAGAIFGVVYGSVLVSIGSTLGATAAFFAGRTVARDWVRRRIAAWPKFVAVDRAVESRGFFVVLLTRLSPLFPFFLLNYAYGVTAAKPRDYVLGSWLGMMPATIAYVYAGSLAANVSQALAGEAQLGSTGWLLLGLGLVATIAVTVLVTRVARGFLEREIGTSGEGAR
jgi:uncharacterized membrane protein YdjX (TVP38/TMEM64 family)